MKTVAAFTFFAALFAAPAAMAAKGQESVVRTIAVTGEGEVRARPDMATLTVGVETKAASPTAALDANAAAMDAAIAALRKEGLEDKDLQTANVSLYPDHRYDRQTESQVLDGYRASNTLKATFRDLDKMGAIITAAVGAGANEMRGLSFGFEDPKPLQERARDAAVADALARAARYARAAGVKLGDVLTIAEPGAPSAPAMRERMEADMAVAAASRRAVPVEPGEGLVSARVNVIFAID